MKRAYVGRARAIAGAGLFGLGMFLLHQQLAGAMAYVKHVLGADSSGVGVAFAVIQVLSRAAQAHGDHRLFLQRFLLHMLVSSWPLLLINTGSVLSRGAFKENVNLAAKKERVIVDSATRNSTSKWGLISRLRRRETK